MLNCSIYENCIKIELDNNSTSPFFNYLLLNTLEIKKIEFFKLLILESNYTYNPFKLGVHLAVYPNPPYKKYNGMTKYLAEQPIVYSDQCLSTMHPLLHRKEAKIIKIGTIILISMMTVACKIITAFTISMGTLVLKGALITHGWMSINMAFVAGGIMVLVKIKKIKKIYFETVKSTYKYKLNKQGFIKTRFLVRKRKLLDIHRQILKIGLLILLL